MNFDLSNRGRRPQVVARLDEVCWVFDVDGCLVDSLTGSSLRPGARDLLRLLDAKARVLLWSAGGGDYARSRAVQFGIAEFIDGFYPKDGRDLAGHYSTSHLPTGPGRVVFVDDRPEDLAEGLEVLTVSPYLADDPYDRALQNVSRVAERP